MFKKELHDNLRAIFGVSKVTYDETGDSYEQDCLFVEIQKSSSNTGQGKASAKVTGAIVMFSQRDKLTYGFFNKRLQQAAPELVNNFFFYDIDVEALNSPARLQNISERRASFVYLYSAQYDPNQGLITSLETEEI